MFLSWLLIFWDQPHLPSSPKLLPKLHLPRWCFCSFLAIFWPLANWTSSVTITNMLLIAWAVNRDQGLPMACYRLPVSTPTSCLPFHARVRVRLPTSMTLFAQPTEPTTLVNLDRVNTARIHLDFINCLFQSFLASFSLFLDNFL